MDSNPAAVPPGDVEAWRAEGVIEYLPETSDVRPHLAASTYVLPSYREGMPRTVFEAMSTGRAIITTDAPRGCRETVIPGENGFLVPVGDADALASAMERLILERWRAPSARAAGRSPRSASTCTASMP